jgi:hypothetical protein
MKYVQDIPLAHAVGDIAEFEEGSVFVATDTVILEHTGEYWSARRVRLGI